MSGPAAVRGFLSYTRVDRRLVDRFRTLLTPRLANHGGADVSVWWDEHVLVGQPWDEEIRAAIRRADFGLLLVSPGLLSRDYIRTVEIPMLLASKAPVLAVGLRRVDIARSDLWGIDPGAIVLYADLRHREPRWFADLGGQNPARFCDMVAARIADRLLASRP